MLRFRRWGEDGFVSSTGFRSCRRSHLAGLGWEWRLLEKAVELPSLPRVLDYFVATIGTSTLSRKCRRARRCGTAGTIRTTAQPPYGWARQRTAEVAAWLHGAVGDPGRPSAGHRGRRRKVPSGRAERPLGPAAVAPAAESADRRPTLYTAPSWCRTAARRCAADLYSFGAMLYALHVGRELTEIDFDRHGDPKPFVPRCPDALRVRPHLMKTFRARTGPSLSDGRSRQAGPVRLSRTRTHATGRGASRDARPARRRRLDHDRHGPHQQ